MQFRPVQTLHGAVRMQRSISNPSFLYLSYYPFFPHFSRETAPAAVNYPLCRYTGNLQYCWLFPVRHIIIILSILYNHRRSSLAIEHRFISGSYFRSFFTVYVCNFCASGKCSIGNHRIFPPVFCRTVSAAISFVPQRKQASAAEPIKKAMDAGDSLRTSFIRPLYAMV